MGVRKLGRNSNDFRVEVFGERSHRHKHLTVKVSNGMCAYRGTIHGYVLSILEISDFNPSFFQGLLESEAAAKVESSSVVPVKTKEVKGIVD